MTKKHTKEEVVENESVNVEEEAQTDLPQPEEEPEQNDNLADDKNSESDIASQLNEQLQECQDRYIRLQADFDNFRKRTLKEKMELIDSAGAEVIKSVLTVMDDMDRAVAAMQTSDDINAMRQGIELISNKLQDVLKQRQVKEIPALGEEFNTDYHDAIAKVPVEDETKKGKIIDVIEKGYLLKDKVIRFSKVVVGE